ncbi:MAG: ABC transporter permease [Bacteroidales bacterium]|nr:ABC transporter permease [Bacteroidales bacterium]
MYFFKTVLRNFTHNRLYTTINILGLAIGLSCFTFIFLYVQDELSYDKHHKKYKRIYRLESDITISDKHQQVSKSSFAIGPTFKKEFPEIEAFVRFREIEKSFLSYKDKQFYEDLLYYTDSSVFKIFTHKFIQGNPEIALTQPNTIVLTESISKKYFGDEDPLGKVINLSNVLDCKVTAIIKDVPENSHLRFNGLISIDSYSKIIGEKMYQELSTIHFWAIRLFTYVLLKENSSIESVHEKFPAFHDVHIKPISKKLNGTFKLLTTGLDKIHLYSDLGWDLPTGDINAVYIISIIAVFILLIAAINYMNLATARSSHKAKEVGIRKVIGAYKAKLSRSLIGESIILSLISFILSIVIVEAMLPFFNTASDKSLSFEIFTNPFAYLVLLLVTILIGILSGTYPAFYLSSFRPVIVLKGVVSTGKKSGILRKLLIVFQFTISITMIAGTIIVHRQMNFIKNQDLGFNKKNVMVVRATDTTFKKEMQVFKDKLLQNPNIYNVTTSNNVPGGGSYMDVFLVEGKEKMEEQLMSFIHIDYNFIDLMGMKIVKGRNFSKKFGTDKEQGIIINWMAAKKLGWNENALGKEIHQRSYETNIYKVIGVVEDFNFSSLREEIGPIVFLLENQPGDLLSIRMNPKNKEETFSSIDNLWQKLNPNEPFKYDYLEDMINEMYESDDQLQSIIGYFAILSIFISLLGLFGLSSFITEQFSKDIGIRKLLGASVRSIVYLLSRDFLKLIFIAFIIATPIAWLTMNNWLDHFAYRINIQIYWFILTGIVVLLFAQLTVIAQTIKTAMTNPVDVIKYE